MDRRHGWSGLHSPMYNIKAACILLTHLLEKQTKKSALGHRETKASYNKKVGKLCGHASDVWLRQKRDIWKTQHPNVQALCKEDRSAGSQINVTVWFTCRSLPAL